MLNLRAACAPIIYSAFALRRTYPSRSAGSPVQSNKKGQQARKGTTWTTRCCSCKSHCKNVIMTATSLFFGVLGTDCQFSLYGACDACALPQSLIGHRGCASSICYLQIVLIVKQVGRSSNLLILLSILLRDKLLPLISA